MKLQKLKLENFVRILARNLHKKSILRVYEELSSYSSSSEDDSSSEEDSSSSAAFLRLKYPFFQGPHSTSLSHFTEPVKGSVLNVLSGNTSHAGIFAVVKMVVICFQHVTKVLACAWYGFEFRKCVLNCRGDECCAFAKLTLCSLLELISRRTSVVFELKVNPNFLLYYVESNSLTLQRS